MSKGADWVHVAQDRDLGEHGFCKRWLMFAQR
jgi:hypothetical protein